MAAQRRRLTIGQDKLIIGVVIALWLMGFFIPDELPGWATAALFVLGFLSIGGLVAFLMTRGSGWHALAQKYPQGTTDMGQLRRCRTFQMVATDSDQRFGTRFSGGIISVGASADALYIATPSFVRFLFPTIRLPWSAIASAKQFDAPGWVKPLVEPGAIIQAKYDPGYRGPFIELETTEPRTCIRLPLYALGDAHRNLPLTASPL